MLRANKTSTIPPPKHASHKSPRCTPTNTQCQALRRQWNNNSYRKRKQEVQQSEAVHLTFQASRAQHVTRQQLFHSNHVSTTYIVLSIVLRRQASYIIHSFLAKDQVVRTLQMRLTPCYRYCIEGVLFVLLYVLLFILCDIPLPRVLPLLHHKSCATRQHTTLSYDIRLWFDCCFEKLANSS